MNILIVSNNTIFRQGITNIVLRGSADRKIFTSDSLNSIPSTVIEAEIKYCFIDFAMLPNERWIDVLTKLTKLSKEAGSGVCLFSNQSNRNLIETAYKAGIRGLIFEDSEIDSINEAVDKVLKGRVFFPKIKTADSNTPDANQDELLNFTLRQKEILSLLNDGHSNKKIGRFLGISESTVKQHFSKIFKMLSVNNRVEALRKARDHGVI